MANRRPKVASGLTILYTTGLVPYAPTPTKHKHYSTALNRPLRYHISRRHPKNAYERADEDAMASPKNIWPCQVQQAGRARISMTTTMNDTLRLFVVNIAGGDDVLDDGVLDSLEEAIDTNESIVTLY